MTMKDDLRMYAMHRITTGRILTALLPRADSLRRCTDIGQTVITLKILHTPSEKVATSSFMAFGVA